MEFVVCINNQDYSASLEIRKIYQVLPDPKANKIWRRLLIPQSLFYGHRVIRTPPTSSCYLSLKSSQKPCFCAGLCILTDLKNKLVGCVSNAHAPSTII